ncbi:MAG: hypothetical protein KAJ73_00220 [Zetaproteobacteria bacterium]|nr:hypothetical protein [Zetaproteobacteria bacterium]
MNENEKQVREILTSAIKMGTTVDLSIDLWRACGNAVPHLTFSQCKEISASYPYSWTEIRAWFPLDYYSIADKFIERENEQGSGI